MNHETKTTEMLRAIARSEPLHVAHAALLLWADHRLEVVTLLPGESVVLGRGVGADLRVDSSSVSRHHARFAFDGDAVRVEDLGSRNGTSFGNQPISKVVAVSDGSHVVAGDVVIGIRVFASAPPAAAQMALPQVVVSATTRTKVSAVPSTMAPPVLFGGEKTCALERMVDRLAPLSPPVLVLGETGTGKELLAHALHDRGPRAKHPFRALNCGALPASMLEGVLFGYVRGAFTGADQARAGIFEEAGEGTVFLDEIGELSPAAQVALLRVLETRTVTRLGSNKDTMVGARVLAATHRDLNRMVAEKTFREDLLHRLNTFVIELPPLRERHDEIRALSERFIGYALAEVGLQEIWVDDAVWPALEAAPWTGNVRELRNTLMRAVALCSKDVLTLADLRWDRGHSVAASSAPDRKIEAAAALAVAALPSQGFKHDMRERALHAIRDALAKTGGHKGRAAELLGMPIRTFRRRLRELEGTRDEADGD